MIRVFFILFYLISSYYSLSQSHDRVVFHSTYEILDRWQIKYGSPSFSSLRPFHATGFQLILDSAYEGLTPVEKFQQDYLRIENREYVNQEVGKSKKPMLKYFYRYKSDLISFHNESLDLHLNPIWQLNAGMDSNVDEILYTNSRGIEIRGTIDEKVAFYTQATTNQINYPAYVKNIADTAGVVPFEGFWKEYDNDYTVDFFRAFGYVDFGLTKHISAQLGYGRHFVGSGMRSMILSDFSNSYPYLRIDTEIWKFRYTNLFAELIGDVFTFPGGTRGNSTYPKKYLFYHQLEFRPVDNLSISLFESVIAGRPDSLGSELKPEYFIPVIFYRAVEQQDGSEDNVILGMDFKWDLWKKFRIYGQFVLDEMVISELIDNNGWWGNKYGYQLGIHYVDFLLKDLDVKAEYNAARPFTYAHDDFYTSYTHYEQPLAHPLGANFREVVGKLTYRPFPRFTTELNGMFARYGNDEEEGVSLGRNPFISYNARDRQYGHNMLQGIQTDVILINSLTSYQLRHNLFIDLSVTYRSETSQDIDQTSTIFTTGFRWNLPYRNYIF